MHQRLSRAAALLVLVLVPGLSSSSGRVLAQAPATAINPADVIPFDAALATGAESPTPVRVVPREHAEDLIRESAAEDLARESAIASEDEACAHLLEQVLEQATRDIDRPSRRCERVVILRQDHERLEPVVLGKLPLEPFGHAPRALHGPALSLDDELGLDLPSQAVAPPHA